MAQLDLIELADLVRPDQIVGEILRQNPDLPVPVPLEELAYLAGITKIEPLSSEGFEGTLIADANKARGAIFYSALSPRPRQRFTIGHELGHFLLPWHRQTVFECTAADIRSKTNKEWERQANEFSSELIMPTDWVKRRLLALRDPELAHIFKLREEFQTSMEMTARRVVELSEYACAVVFSKENSVLYSVRSHYFTHSLCVKSGDRLPTKSPSRAQESDPDEWCEIDAHWWLTEVRGRGEMPESIYEQTLVQERGYKVTLLAYEP